MDFSVIKKNYATHAIFNTPNETMHKNDLCIINASITNTFYLTLFFIHPTKLPLIGYARMCALLYVEYECGYYITHGLKC